MKPARACAALLLFFSLIGASVGATGCARPTTQAQSEDALRNKLAAHREQQIQRLHEYAVAGKFPHNVTTTSGLHMFRDAQGNYCAVANLVHQDGRDDLVDATVRDRNDLAIHDVNDGPMMDWVLSSGLTKEELERIQLPAPPMRTQLVAPPVDPTPKPSPVDEIAQNAAKNRPAPRATVNVLDEDAMKAHVRAHLARVEAELRRNKDASLAVAVERAKAAPVPARLASR